MSCLAQDSCGGGAQQDRQPGSGAATEIASAKVASAREVGYTARRQVGGNQAQCQCGSAGGNEPPPYLQ